ncbi:MAG: TfoX/Sxy family protein [Alistipes sp.]|nr:TfoX/Sxy family protein [Alistipes sp.]
MACSADFVQYVIDQCSDAGSITVRKMMGDYCIYCDGALFGLICDNTLFVKVTEACKDLLHNPTLRPPYAGAKEYLEITDIDNRDLLTAIIRITLKNLPTPKTKRK